MSRRSILEQEMYEALIEQGVDEMTADIVAREQVEEGGWGDVP